MENTHGTILIGWNESGDVLYARTFEFTDKVHTEREQALAAFDEVTKTCRYWVFGDSGSILNKTKFAKEETEEEE